MQRKNEYRFKMREESECQQEMKLSAQRNKTYKYSEWNCGDRDRTVTVCAQLCTPATCKSKTLKVGQQDGEIRFKRTWGKKICMWES